MFALLKKADASRRAKDLAAELDRAEQSLAEAKEHRSQARAEVVAMENVPVLTKAERAARLAQNAAENRIREAEAQISRLRAELNEVRGRLNAEATLKDATARAEAARASLGRVQAHRDKVAGELATLRAERSDLLEELGGHAALALDAAERGEPPPERPDAGRVRAVEMRMDQARAELDLIEERMGAIRGELKNAEFAADHARYVIAEQAARAALVEALPALEAWRKAALAASGSKTLDTGVGIVVALK